IEAIYRNVVAALPRGYTTDTGIRSYLVLMGAKAKDESLPKPDVTVAEPPEDADSVPMQAFIAEKFEETFVEIYAEGKERILVTCIEVLSPSNKRQDTEGWREYKRKRQALLLGRANFIEIDLLRGGDKMPMLTPWPDSPYTLLVSRAERAPRCRVWLGHFQRRLPA